MKGRDCRSRRSLSNSSIELRSFPAVSLQYLGLAKCQRARITPSIRRQETPSTSMLPREQIMHKMSGEGWHSGPLVSALEGYVTEAENHGRDDILFMVFVIDQQSTSLPDRVDKVTHLILFAGFSFTFFVNLEQSRPVIRFHAHEAGDFIGQMLAKARRHLLD